jgi:prepilin-type N-terminal cleavage/methylation domain-containing protein
MADVVTASRCTLVRESRSGFSLIELIVAITIFAIIALGLAATFDKGTVAWENGTRRTQQALAGRACLDIIAYDLSQAIANAEFPCDFNSGSKLEFYSLSEPRSQADAHEAVKIIYEVNGDNLLVRITEESAPSGTPPTIQPVSGSRKELPMSDGIMDFSVVPSIPTTDTLPPYIDIFITVRSIVDETRNLEQNDRMFSQRIYFANRNRYRYD